MIVAAAAAADDPSLHSSLLHLLSVAATRFVAIAEQR